MMMMIIIIIIIYNNRRKSAQVHFFFFLEFDPFSLTSNLIVWNQPCTQHTYTGRKIESHSVTYKYITAAAMLTKNHKTIPTTTLLDLMMVFFSSQCKLYISFESSNRVTCAVTKYNVGLVLALPLNVWNSSDSFSVSQLNYMKTANNSPTHFLSLFSPSPKSSARKLCMFGFNEWNDVHSKNISSPFLFKLESSLSDFSFSHNVPNPKLDLKLMKEKVKWKINRRIKMKFITKTIRKKVAKIEETVEMNEVLLLDFSAKIG